MNFYQFAVAQWSESENVSVAAVILWPIQDEEPGRTGYRQPWLYSNRLSVPMEQAIVDSFFESAYSFGGKDREALWYIATCPVCHKETRNIIDRSLRPFCACGTHKWAEWLRMTRVDTDDLTVANKELARIGRAHDARFPEKPFTR